MWQYNHTNELYHHGILGMKWGRHKAKSSGTSSHVERAVYSVGAKLNPREVKYNLRKMINNPNLNNELLSQYTKLATEQTGVLPTNTKALKAVETMGIKAHSKAVYDNLDKEDISHLKTYTDSARYSRSVNGYLAIGDPKAYAAEAEKLKTTLRKNQIKDQTVYRSCNMQFSVNGVAKKLSDMSEEELKTTFSGMSKNFSGKSIGENRVFSTSTSPLFAIDTWRKVNPTAASTYNTYMIINCKNCPGLLADGKTKDGKALVNTRSNQEAILAPNKLTYRKLEYDKERDMYAITVDAS